MIKSCSSYSEVVKQNRKKNKQGIFDRQNEMCEFFTVLSLTNGVDINYKVSNDCILIKVAYDNNSQWNANQGKRTLWKLVEKYKLDLLANEKHLIRFHKSVSFWTKKRLICEYYVPLNLLKFNVNIFYYSEEYLNYKKGYFNKFELF